MWSIENIDAVPVELDFSSSGQDVCSATAVEAAGIRLFNAIELVEVKQDGTQVEVCESCGIPRCSPGGWVAFRRIDDRVVWIPAWEQMEQDTWADSEFRPPSFVQRKGAPVFSPAAWSRLRALHGGLPTCDALPPLSSREAARLCQWSAPYGLLGEYPGEPRLRRDLLIAVTDGDLDQEAGAIRACLEAHFRAPRQMALVPQDVPVCPIEFWLDLPGTPAWIGFAHVENKVCFLVEGDLALIAEGEVTSHSS